MEGRGRGEERVKRRKGEGRTEMGRRKGRGKNGRDHQNLHE